MEIFLSNIMYSAKVITKTPQLLKKKKTIRRHFNYVSQLATQLYFTCINLGTMWDINPILCSKAKSTPSHMGLHPGRVEEYFHGRDENFIRKFIIEKKKWERKKMGRKKFWKNTKRIVMHIFMIEWIFCNYFKMDGYFCNYIKK